MATLEDFVGLIGFIGSLVHLVICGAATLARTTDLNTGEVIITQRLRYGAVLVAQAVTGLVFMYMLSLGGIAGIIAATQAWAQLDNAQLVVAGIIYFSWSPLWTVVFMAHIYYRPSLAAHSHLCRGTYCATESFRASGRTHQHMVIKTIHTGWGKTRVFMPAPEE